MPRSPKALSFLQVSPTKMIAFFSSTRALQPPPPPHSPWCHHPNTIWWRTQPHSSTMYNFLLLPSQAQVPPSAAYSSLTLKHQRVCETETMSVTIWLISWDLHLVTYRSIYRNTMRVKPLRSNSKLNYIQRSSPYRAVNKLRLGYKNQSVNVV